MGTESVTSYDIRGEVPALETWRGGTDNVFLFFDKKTDDVLSLRRLRPFGSAF